MIFEPFAPWSNAQTTRLKQSRAATKQSKHIKQMQIGKSRIGFHAVFTLQLG
jgi:hypothetical protein